MLARDFCEQPIYYIFIKDFNAAAKMTKSLKSLRKKVDARGFTMLGVAFHGILIFLVQTLSLSLETVESWRAGKLESWRAGELESWRAEAEMGQSWRAGDGVNLSVRKES